MRLSIKQVREYALMLAESKTAQEAYLKLHPDANPKWAKINAKRLLKNPRVNAEYMRIMDRKEVKVVQKITRDFIVSMYNTVIEDYLQDRALPPKARRIKTNDFINALENLQKLCPEFVDRKVIDHYREMPEDELDRTLRDKLSRLGGVSGVN